MSYNKTKTSNSSSNSSVAGAEHVDVEKSSFGKVLSAEQQDIAHLDRSVLKAELAAIDPAVEKRVVRALDKRIVPVVTLLYMMAFVDRANMGNARILGMGKDLDLVGNRFNIALTGFFITYVLFEIPANLLCKKFGPKTWLPLIVFGFGLVTMCLGFVQSYHGLIAARVMLGIMESSIMPSIAYTLGTFYRRHELVSRVGFYASFASLAGAFGGLLATGLSKIPAWGIMHTWRNIFFFEGLLTMALAVAAYFILPDSPGTASFLSEPERKFAHNRIMLEIISKGTEKFEWKYMRRALNLNTILITTGLFCSLLCMNSIALFMPSLLHGFGFGNIQSQLMTVPPYAVGTVICIVAALASDRYKTRGVVLLVIAPVMILGFALLLAVESRGVKYFAIFLATQGGFTGSPILIAWLVDNTSGPIVRAIASAIGCGIGSAGAILATWTYRADVSPSGGHLINLVGGCVLFFVALSGTVYLRWENKQRAEGKRDHRLHDITEEEASHLGHYHPAFVYTT